MHQDEAGLTSEELIEVAAEAGFEVSAYQLERWRREGLIPRPRQIGLGRGRGSIVLHPEGTDEQLLALLRFKEIDRRLSKVGWRLWGEGFPVVEFVRKRMESAIRDRLKRVNEFLDRLYDNDAGLEYPRLPGLGAWPHRISKGAVQLMMRAANEALAGSFDGDWVTVADDAKLIRKALSWEATPQETDEEYVERFRDIYGWVTTEANVPDFLAALDRTSDQELEQLRDEARAGLSVVLSSLRAQSLPVAPFFFLAWFWARKVSPTLMFFVNQFVAQPDWLDQLRRSADETYSGGRKL